MAKLVLMLKGKILREVGIGPQGVKIGRDASNDIQIDNVAVSRFHAVVYRQGYPFYLEDKESTNGTYLDGSRISWKTPLSHNQKITIGKHTLRFVEEPSDSAGQKASRGADTTLCLSPEDLARLRENN